MTLSKIVRYLLLWQAGVITVTILSAHLLPLRESYLGGGTQTYLANPLLYSRANFDGVHYTQIAQNGYGYAQQAFFPLYPQLIRQSSGINVPPQARGVAISLISFAVGLVFFARLVSLDEPAPVVRFTLLALLFFPVSFYFGFVYTEGLFFMLLILAIYCGRTRRFWLAGLFGALAAYTRLVGIFILPVLIIEWWIQVKTLDRKSQIISLLPILFVPLGLFSFTQFLQQTTGDPLAFIHVQSSFGQGRSDKIVLLYQVFWRYAKMIATVNRSDPQYLTIILEAITGIIFLATSVYSLVKTRISYAVFNISAFLLPTLTGNFASLPRYVLVCFPSFILFGRFLAATHPINRKILAVSGGVLFFIFLSLFVRGYWVA